MSGVTVAITRYESYGPLLASFLSNLLATFGDKGQLVVIMLASRYDARRVFAGAMAAFALWSALEVALGAWVTSVLPAALLTLLTGTLFVLFGAWTLVSVVRGMRGSQSLQVAIDGGTDAPEDLLVDSQVLPAQVEVLGTYGPTITAFLFILFAEFGDKTQLLTINLAATFPDSPVAVFVGVLAALGLRTGVDAAIGGQAHRYLPSRLLELAAAVVFLAFGAAVFGLVGTGTLLAVVVASIAVSVAGAVWLATR